MCGGVTPPVPAMGVADLLCCNARKLDKVIELLSCKCECNEVEDDDDSGNGNGNGNS